MNKKEFLKSINNIDDKFLREGEEFFTPVEAEENITLYRKKRSCIKPLISAAACCAVVVAAAVVMVNVNGNLPVATASANSENTEATEGTEAAENADITADSDYQKEIEAAISSAAEAMTEDGITVTLDPQYESNILTEVQNPSEAPEVEAASSSENDNLFIVDVKSSLSGTEVKENGTLNIIQPQEIKVSLDCTTAKGGGEAKPARFFVFKDGTPVSFSTEEAANVTYYDTMFLPESKISVPISFTADKSDRHISIFCIIDPMNAEVTGTGIFCADYINAACTEGPTLGEYTFQLESYDDNASELKDIKLGELDTEGYHAYINYSEGRGLDYIVFFVNGQPVPAFGGDYRGIMCYNADSSLYNAYIPNKFIKSGDVVYAVLIDGINSFWDSSYRTVIE